MDRGKSSSGRGSKTKTPQFPQDLYVLGSKGSSAETKQRSAPVHSGPKQGLAQPSGERERKRDGPSLSGAVPAKKAKLTATIQRPGVSAAASSGSLSLAPSSGSSSSSSSTSAETWESLALDVDIPDLIPNVLEALENDDIDRSIGLVCGAIKLLKTQRFKVDSILYIGFTYLSKIKNSLFTNEFVVAGLSSLLKRDVLSSSFKSLPTKMNISSALLAVTLLSNAFKDMKKWPESLIKLYLEDAGGERNWVDHELARTFSENIVHSLGTKQSTSVLPDPAGRPEQQEDDIVTTIKMTLTDHLFSLEYHSPSSRFRWNREAIESIVLETVKEQLSKRQSVDLINRNFLRMLTALCGVTEIRLLISPKIEAWIQNPKLTRSAQELLMSLCVNCCTHTMKDVEVISSLIKMRLKTKALSNYYLSCIKELVMAHPDNLGTVLKHTIYNELSNSRNPNNMPMLGVIFQCNYLCAADRLATIFLELLMNRDDYLRPLRSLLRELARVLRHELKLQNFCQGLMSHTEPLSRDIDSSRSLASTVDIIALCIFLAVMPHARTEKKDLSQMEKMQHTISTIQCDAVWWLNESVLSVYKPTQAEYLHALRKVLLLEPAEQYYKTDNWPPEQDRSLFMRMASEVPVLEKTLITLFMIGLSKEHPIVPSDAMDIASEVVRRAAAVNNPITPVLKCDQVSIIDCIFNLSIYRHPDNIDLPAGYKPPSLAISTFYWKAWTLLLILSAHNPAKFGEIAWNKYPTLRVLMEMCITSHFAFPPGYEDLQLLTVEKQAILEFETHLAAASTKMEITEHSSLLLSQLISMDPHGPPRRPPQVTVDALKAMNGPLKLGHLLCRSRQPDFLLDIIQRQGSSQSMPWLADLVQNSEGALNHLPVQCLCEFLLSSAYKQEGKYQQLLKHLHNILTDPNQDPINACEVLDYFLRRLSSPNNRASAICGLKLVISPLVEDDIEPIKDKSAVIKEDPSWLMEQLPRIPHFEAARAQIVASLRSACQVENEPNLVTAYLCFLSQHATGDLNEMGELVLDMAQLIVERSTIMASILPSGDKPNPALDAFLLIFYNYLTKAREPKKDKYTWSESQDQVLVSWHSGEECTVYILVVHAMVILLTYGSTVPINSTDQYDYLLNTWFPRDISKSPKGFLVDTSEEALLIPDWLKLRMIRSHVPRLVNAALTDLDMGQLILFIQSFGIPIASMSKLLATIDAAVLIDPDAVSDAVIDKTYMIQLVEVQHKRGAKGGEEFVRILDSNYQAFPLVKEEISPMEIDEPKPTVSSLEKKRFEPTYLTEEKFAATLDFMFASSSSSIKENSFLFADFQRTLVRQFIQEKRKKESPLLQNAIVPFLQKIEANPHFLDNVIKTLQYSCSFFRLLANIVSERHIRSILAKLLKKKDSRAKPLIDILSTALKDTFSTMAIKSEEMDTTENESPLTDTMNRLLICRDEEAGYLVDKLVKHEPEILGSNIEIQMKLLFCKRKVSTLQCRPYLLTLLTHHASWKTLHDCVEILLKKDSVSQYEPTPVLDFLKALTCNPKLWQGREKHTPKHYTPEDILNLDINQLKVLTDYIVSEGVNAQEGFVPEANKDLKYHLSQRLSLLHQCIVATDIRYAADIAKHLISTSSPESKNREEAEMCQQLLIQLYLKIPSLITHLSESQVKKRFHDLSSLSVGGCCTTDFMSHNLITALSEASSLKEWSKKSQELELCLRKMASTHPLLILRQLPMIAAILRGRFDLEWSVFNVRGHWRLFQQIANIIELLQPIIYQDHYAPSLHNILAIYLDLFMSYMRESLTLSPVVNQFTTFMQGYIKHNVKQVEIFIKNHAELISDLQDDYPILRSLCLITTDKKFGNEIIITPPNLADSSNTQWDGRVVLSKKDDLATIFQFLDKKPNGVYFPFYCSMIKHSNIQVRAVCHNLIARHVKMNPKAASEAICSYLSCLESDNPDVVLNALEKLPEIIVCAQELGPPVLQKVFNLGIYNNINTLQCISKTIALLNLQSAC